MDKIIGLTGAHGSGKTTTLSELERRGYTVDPFKVSRTVQQKRGWSDLSQALTSFEEMYQFQIDILETKYAHDLKLKNEGHGSFVLVERTFLDIYAYASYWTWEFHSFNSQIVSPFADRIDFETATKFLMWFRNKCEQAQIEIYAGVCLLPRMSHIQFAEDPNRASKEVSANITFETMEHLAHHINSPKIQVPTYKMSGKTVAERADEIEKFMRTL